MTLLPNNNLRLVIWRGIHMTGFYMSALLDVKNFIRILLENMSNGVLDSKFTEAVVRTCSLEKVFLEISQNLQENTCVSVSCLINFQAWGLQLY